MSNYKFLALSDIHIDILDPEFQYKQLEDNVLVKIREDGIDIVIVAGDIMDTKVALNSKSSAMFNRFIDALYALEGVTVLIIEGTRTHDDNQILAHSHKVSDTFRIYSKVTHDIVYGMNMLFIPEEYMQDPEEYYKEYLDGSVIYDFVFGHGMFDHIGFVSKKKVRIKRLTSPMWNYDIHFDGLVLGYVVFGHYHRHSNYKLMYYIGATGRYNHGEEEPKGFITWEYDTDTKETTPIVHHETEDSKLFITILESKLSDDNDEAIEELIKVMKSAYRLRIRLDQSVEATRRSVIVGVIRENPLQCSLDDKYTSQKNKLARNKDVLGGEIVENKYEGMDTIDATIEFITEHYGIIITREEITRLISDGVV